MIVVNTDRTMCPRIDELPTMRSMLVRRESLHQSLCAPLHKRVSVLKFEIGYEVGIAYVGKIIKVPTSRKEGFCESVLIEQEW